jgi:hypothetical protein
VPQQNLPTAVQIQVGNGRYKIAPGFVEAARFSGGQLFAALRPRIDSSQCLKFGIIRALA